MESNRFTRRRLLSATGLGAISLIAGRVSGGDDDEPTTIITDVAPNGPADGILRGSDREVERHGEFLPVGGDVLLEIDGEPVHDPDSVTSFLALETSPGDDVLLTIDRNGSIETVELTLGTRPITRSALSSSPAL